jgi:two-component sensor histidine kinase
MTSPMIIDQETVVKSLDSNLQFVSELLQADIRLFVKRKDGIYIHNYFHPNQDSLYLAPRAVKYARGEKLKPHKDVPVDKAFRLGKRVVGQYGLVINNRRIQEFAFPIGLEENDPNPIAVIAFERDVYVTRNILGRHWDFMADNLIKALEQKIKDGTSFPSIAFGEGALIIQEITNQESTKQKNIFFANPLAVHLLSEIAEHAYQLVGRLLDDIFANFTRKSKGSNSLQSISLIEEISLRQRTIVLRHVVLNAEMSVVLIKDNSEVKMKDTLLKEIHHRVKNNLQTIISLLRLQKRRNPELEGAFDEAINRTNSIALVHEYLSRSNDIENIDFGFLVQKLLKGLLTSFGADDLVVDFDCPKKVFIASEEATNLALVLNEIITNTLEHTSGTLSRIKIRLYQENQDVHLYFEDDGGGFKEGFDYRQSTGLGWEIVRTIAEESLKGKLTIENIESDGRAGIRVHLVVPVSV